jgi:hypothetical protein
LVSSDPEMGERLDAHIFINIVNFSLSVVYCPVHTRHLLIIMSLNAQSAGEAMHGSGASRYTLNLPAPKIYMKTLHEQWSACQQQGREAW